MNDRLKNIPVMKLCFFIAALLLLVSTAGAAAAPVAAFTGTPAFGTSPPTVNFTDASTDSPTGWAWFFGDETYMQPWTEQTPSSEWSKRVDHSSVAMPDGSVVLMGGWDDNGTHRNDTWRFQPAGSSLQNPSHTYTAVGTYPVILQAFNADGYSSSQKIGYITVTSPTTTARPSGPPPLMDALLVIAAIAVSGAAGFIRRR